MYIIIMSIIIISYIHTNIKEGDSREKIRKKRKLAFNYPYIIIGSISFIPTIIIISCCILLGLETPIIFSIMSIVLLSSSLIAIIIYMITKEYFEDILIETAYYVENNMVGKKVSLRKKAFNTNDTNSFRVYYVNCINIKFGYNRR